MVYRGHVRNGKIELDPAVSLPEGAEVEVALASDNGADAREQGPTLYDRLKPVIGQAKGLPADLAKNHDHYLYGTPKRT